MPRTRELLRSIKNLRILREIAVTEGALKGVGDLIDNFLDSEAMNQECTDFNQNSTQFVPAMEAIEALR